MSRHLKSPVTVNRIKNNLSSSLVSKLIIERNISFSHRLTKREVNCLVLAARGKTSSETAKLLGIKPSTVETHRKEIKRKLECQNMAHAVFEGILLGYVNTTRREEK